MRTWTDGDRFGVETDTHDAQLASAVRDIVSDGRALAETVGIGADGECTVCGSKDRLRPYPFYVNGEFSVEHICPPCQVEKTENARERYAGDDPETVPSEREGGDEP